MISDETNSYVMAAEEPRRTGWASLPEPIPGFLSVIIPVYKDTEGLAVTLRSLEAQSLPRASFEILVANDGADPRISELCARSGVIEVSLPVNRGSYAARNAALECARGEYIGFADADVRVDGGWCEAGVKALAHADLVAGRTVIDIGANRSAAELYQYCFAFPAGDYARKSGMAQTVNLFARRKCFADLGGFDDRLRSGGDLEWTARATTSGRSLVYAEMAQAFHPSRSYPQLLASSERILYGQLGTQRLHGGDPRLFETVSKSAWRLLAPPSPRSLKRMRDAGLSAVELVKVYFFSWWLKTIWFATLLKVRRRMPNP